MLLKESKIRVLENFYALDYVFFGKSVSEAKSCCPLLKEEYLSIKGALLSVFVEMLKLVDHAPKAIKEQVNSKVLMQSARNTARIARENAQRIVSTPKARAAIKEELKVQIKEDKTLDISEAIEGKIRQKAFSLAVDNLLLARVVGESKSFDKLNDWEGTIIEDSYKILRDNLIESAYDILYSEADVPEEEEIVDEAMDPKKKAIKAAKIKKRMAGALNDLKAELQGNVAACSGKKDPRSCIEKRNAKTKAWFKTDIDKQKITLQKLMAK